MKQEHWIWLRDKFGRWFASTTSFTFMWFAIGLAVAVAYFWDAIWSGRQAPEGLELSFQAGGAVVRTWTVFALVGVVALFRSKAHWLGGILLATWLCTSVMSYGHVLGFVASGQMERYAGGTAVEQKLDIKTDTKAAAIERLEGQLAAVDSDLSSAVAVLDAEIKQYITDGRDNDDLADESRARRGKLQDDAAAEKRKLNAEIIALMTAAADTKVAAQDEGVTAVKFDPLYMWIASALHGPEPSTDQLKTVAARVGAFWAFLIEMIAGAGPAILYAAHAHFADKSEAKDPKRVEAGRRAAKTTARRKRQSDKIEVTAQSLLPSWNKALRYAANTKWSADMIAKNAFKSGDMEYAITVLKKAGLITDEEIAIVKREVDVPEKDPNKVDVVKPETLPAVLNGAGDHITEEDKDADTTSPAS